MSLFFCNSKPLMPKITMSAPLLLDNPVSFGSTIQGIPNFFADEISISDPCSEITPLS